MFDFTGLTEELCVEALDIVRPSIAHAMNSGVVKREQGWLVVLNPRIPQEPKYMLNIGQHDNPKREVPFDELVLFDCGWDLPKNWDHPYDAVARAKAFASWKTGLPAHRIQQEAPYLYEEGWTKYGGSAVGEGGLVVAFSGVEEYFDQMFSEMMVAAIKGVCLHKMHGPEGVIANEDITFLGC
jgi:hypothetical protein